eukprot:m.158980 g.158980  ORF g.158980 m.158980 type:complete len:151 (-) comp20893_c0_seq3:98-550(-)
MLLPLFALLQEMPLPADDELPEHRLLLTELAKQGLALHHTPVVFDFEHSLVTSLADLAIPAVQLREQLVDWLVANEHTSLRFVRPAEPLPECHQAPHILVVHGQLSLHELLCTAYDSTTNSSQPRLRIATCALPKKSGSTRANSCFFADR